MRAIFYHAFIASSVTQAFGASREETKPTCTAVTPAPSECAVRGDIPYEDKLKFPAASPQLVSSLQECATLCGRRVAIPGYHERFRYPNNVENQPFCKSFQYVPSTGECTLGRFPVEKIVEASNKSKSLFFNHQCFDCGSSCTAAQPLRSDLMDNGGFEQPLLGPWFSYLGSLTKGHNSRNAFRCIEGKEFRCRLSQEVNMCKGEFYSFRFDYVTVRNNNQTYLPYIDVGFGGPKSLALPGTGYYSFSAFTKNTDINAWKTVQAYFQFRDGLPAGPYFEQGGGGYTFIDNVKVSRVPSNFPMVKPHRNLFQNPGFETGDISPWKQDPRTGKLPPPFKIASPGINSQYALSFTSAPNARQFGSRTLSQTVMTTPYTTYLLSFNLESKKSYDAYVQYGLTQYTLYSALEGNTTISVPLIAESNMTKIQIKVSSEPILERQKVLLDNFSMLEVAKSPFFP